MKVTILTLTLSIFLGCSASSVDKSNNNSKDNMTLKESIKIWNGSESIVLIPEGTALPASKKQTFTTDENQSLSVYFFRDDGEQINSNNQIGEFWLQQYKDSGEVSKIEVEVVAESNSEFRAIGKDSESGQEKTMIFLNHTDEVENLENFILEKMNLLRTSGGAVNYVIFELDNHLFVQLASGKDDDVIRCEASISDGGSDGNFKETTLSPEKLNQLEKLGWRPPEFGEYNYYYWGSFVAPDSFDSIARNFLQTINSVYGGNLKRTTINLEKGWSEM